MRRRMSGKRCIAPFSSDRDSGGTLIPGIIRSSEPPVIALERQWRRAMRKGLVCGLILAALSGTGSAACAQSANTALNLDHGWQFRQSGSDAKDWLPATVPGDVHLDLLANKRIPDPFYRDDEAKLQWIEQASWEYQD